jgi:integrating conjugative element protein (TIGR03749 family)
MKFCKLLAKIFLSIVITVSITNANAEPESLPLTPKQINKLESLFKTVNSQSFDAMGDFQNPVPHEHLIWKEKPIDIILPLGKERIVHFPESVSFGYDKNSLDEKKLSIQNNNGVLYLTAKKLFTPQRVEVKCNTTGSIILMNLSAKKNVSDTPIDVILADNKNVNRNGENHTAENNFTLGAPSSFSKNPNSVDAIILTRIAAKELYAPKRLLHDPQNIFRTPMHTKKTVPLFLDGSVIAMPLASWRDGDLFVTAVLLRNQEKQSISLDPRILCGHWKTATFYPSEILAPKGSAEDSTTLFLVSNRSFVESMQICTGGLS